MTAAADAALAAAVFAVNPSGLGGVCLRSLVQPARTQWLELLRELLPATAPMRRVPFNISDGRLLGGLDLVATLRANRPIAERGALAASDGGVVVVTMAERLSAHTAACLNAVIDSGEILLQREGVNIHDEARVGIVALDESMTDDERLAYSLLDRFAFLVDLNGFDLRTPLIASHDSQEVAAARRNLPQVTVGPDVMTALCGTGMALGAGSPRVAVLALEAARALAALAGRLAVTVDDATAAAGLVFAPRAMQVPAAAQPAQEQDEPTPPPAPSEQAPPPSEPPPPSEQAPPSLEPPPPSEQAPPPSEPPAASEQPSLSQDELNDIILAATSAAIPHGLLASLRASNRPGQGSASAAMGRVGALRAGGARGRPSGVRSGVPQGNARLNLMETLRAAAPWQRLRGRMSAGDVRVRVDPADFRVTRYQQRSPTLTIFAVDASGSSALNRLAEAKGAVELLLADCYVRRDQVAVVSFRGRAAELLLPPTRSLVRAKRSLAGLPGGGGTPLAAGIHNAMTLAVQAQRRGETPTVVLLTDGRANVARDGTGGRERAHDEAMQVARGMRRANITVLFVDTAPRPSPQARDLAAAMNARYIALPFVSAQALSSVVTAAAGRTAR